RSEIRSGADGDGRRRRRLVWADRSLHRCVVNLLCSLDVLRGRGLGGSIYKYVAPHARVTRLLNLVEQIKAQLRLLHVERHELEIGSLHTAETRARIVAEIHEYQHEGEHSQEHEFDTPLHLLRVPKVRMQFQLQADSAGGGGIQRQIIQEIEILRDFEAVDKANDRGIVAVHLRRDLKIRDAAVRQALGLIRYARNRQSRVLGD